MSAANSFTVCAADKAARTITLYLRDGFGDGTDGFGLLLANPDTQERDRALRIVGEAIDVITGKQPSELPIERWAMMHPAPSEAA